MAITINSFAANTKIESAKVNTNFNNVVSGIEAASYRSFSWGVLGPLVSSSSYQGMQWVCPQEVTAIKVYAFTSSGTCSINLFANGTQILTSNLSVSTSVVSSNTFNVSTLTENQKITMKITSASSAQDVFIVFETQVTENI